MKRIRRTIITQSPGAVNPNHQRVSAVKTSSEVKPEDIYQIVLHNDDSVAAEHVVQCLMTVFKHDFAMAMKIMFDAHNNGRSIAEVEGESDAKKHAEQLSTAKLTVSLERL